MAREIPLSKRAEVAKLYLQGLSYDDIVKRTGVAKGSVTAITQEIREGRLAQFAHLASFTDEVRELAVTMRKAEIAPAEAVLLLSLVKRILGIGVEPSHLETWVRMCESLPQGDLPRSCIVQAAIKLAELEGQGLSYEEAAAKLASSAAQVKQMEEAVQALKSEETDLNRKSGSLKQTCAALEGEGKRLRGDAERLGEKVQQLFTRCQGLEKEVEKRQAAVSHLEERKKELDRRLPQLEEKAQTLEKEVADRTETLRAMEAAGFAADHLERLRTVLGEMAQRHGREELPAKFFEHLGSYDTLVTLEAQRDALAAEVETLTHQKESLAKLGEKFGISTHEVAEGAATMKFLTAKGVSPSAIVSYHRVLSRAGGDHQSFQKTLDEYGGVGAAVAARRKELAELVEEIEREGQVLRQLRTEEANVKDSITALKESGIKEVQALASSAAAQIEKSAQKVQGDIAKWGEVRAEMGKYGEELKLARYFAVLPLSEEALSSLVEDIGAPVVVQYLTIALTWCQKKLNPKLRPPQAITKKYYKIAEYTEVELADLITWALLMFMEGVGRDQGRA